MSIDASGREARAGRARRDPDVVPKRECARVARVGTRALACVIASVVVSAAAHAQTREPSVFLQAGDGTRAAKSAVVGGTIDFVPVDPSRPTPWTFYGEVAVGEWWNHYRDAGQRAQFTQVSLVPVVRFSPSFAPAVFVEAGIGAAFIAPHYQDHEHRFSTVFNFDDHVGLGFRFGDRGDNEVTVRAQHFSNGGIKDPNPGINFAQLRYARHF